MQEISVFISNHPLLSAATFIVLIFVTIVEFVRARRNTLGISPAQLTQMMNRENAVVIDVRQNEIWRKSHIIDALCMDGKEITENPKKLEKFKARPIVIVANTGAESQKISSFLLKQGYNAFSLNGGMRAWSEAQMPLVGDKT